MQQPQTYEEAFRELAAIAKAIETEAVSVDELASKVKRAAELIDFCQARLRSTENEVNRIIKGMDGQQTQ